ncbi:hypothetical protein PIB30_082560, partial [Stylosanthes scabra]|nr:hypothetical protein [Stylosanthes scabra]
MSQLSNQHSPFHLHLPPGASTFSPSCAASPPLLPLPTSTSTNGVSNGQKVLRYPLLIARVFVVVAGPLCRVNVVLYVYFLACSSSWPWLHCLRSLRNQQEQHYAVNDEVKSCLMNASVCHNLALHGGSSNHNGLLPTS